MHKRFVVFPNLHLMPVRNEISKRKIVRAISSILLKASFFQSNSEVVIPVLFLAVVSTVLKY